MTITLTAPIGPNFAQGTVTAADEAITLRRFTTWNYIAIQITGTWSGTITFEVTVDGATWVAVSVIPAASVTPASTATANGVWGLQNFGFAGFRARFSTASSGTPAISIKSLGSQA